LTTTSRTAAAMARLSVSLIATFGKVNVSYARGSNMTAMRVILRNVRSCPIPTA